VTNRIQPSGSGAPAYYPSGPQQNVAISTVTSGGWTQCFVQKFNVSGTNLETQIKNGCTKDYLMVAGRETDASTLLLAAAATRAEVFTATTANNKNIANGTGWYFRTGYSMGFALPSQAVNLSTCDTGTGVERFCTHLSNVGGHRIGSLINLHTSTAYERIYFQADTVVASVPNDQVFSNQPVVQIQDQDGNVVTSGADSSQNVVASIDAGLTGNATVAAVNGVATFTNLKYTGLVGSKTITYAIASPSAINVNDSFTLTYGTATKVVAVTAAAGAVNGVNFTTQPTVEIQDVSGNKVANSTASITASTSAGAVLGGTVTNSASAGSFTYTNLKLTGEAKAYTLTFASTGLTSAVQNITNAPGAATQISIVGSSTSVNDQALGMQPVVTVKDASGNTVVGSTASITLTATGATIGGTVTMNAVAGVADFDGKGVKLTGLVGSEDHYGNFESWRIHR
jgi:hypothetical protein